MSRRKDAKITTKGKRATVRCPNATTIGYGKWQASPGDFVAFKIDEDTRYGRVVGRVDASGSDGDPVKGWICVVMLGTTLHFAHEYWVNPEWVIEVRTVNPNHVRFFEVFFTADPMDLIRMSEYGSLSCSEHATNALPPKRDANEG